ncbi:MAG: biotin/lipoyl-containing protein, partial [Propionicimonas sp.]
MAQVVVMPQLGNTVESCLVTTWLVAVGDTVEAGTLLCEIETDKSAMEVPSGVAGTVLALLAEEGDDVPVKQAIAVVGAVGDSVDEALAAAGQAAPASEPTVEPAAEPTGSATTPVPGVTPPSAVPTAGGAAVSPRARGVA